MSGVVVLTPEQLQKIIRDTWDQARRQTDPKEVLTLEECAELLKMSTRVVTKYVKDDGLPAHKIGPEYRFRRSEVLAWLESRRVA